MTRLAFVVCIGLSALHSFTPLSAQVPDRSRIIDNARSEANSEIALDNVMPLVNPTVAGTDRLWAEALTTLGLHLVEGSVTPDPDLAQVWFRWGIRIQGEWAVDPSVYANSVIDSYRSARDAVERSSDAEGEADVETTWSWTNDFDRTRNGILRVSSTTMAALRVFVDGRPVTPDQGVPLAPGTYTVSSEADGYEPAVAVREVLPGVTTELTFGLAPVLSARAASMVGQYVLQLRAGSAEDSPCINAIQRNGSALLLVPSLNYGSPASLSPVREGIEVQAPLARSSGDLEIVPATGLGGVPAFGPWAPTSGAHVWALYRDGCAPELRLTRARVSSVQGADVLLDRQLPEPAIGGALADATGTPVGVILGVDRAAIFTNQLQASIDALLRETPPGPTPGGGGGLPWKWIGGAGAAGVLAAVLLGGDPPPPTTGDLIVTLPGG